MSESKLEFVRGSDNPFRDAGLSDPDTKLMKADLAAGIIRVLRERDLSGAQAAALAGVTEADISRIRKADLNRFTIDRLVRILNRLDSQVQVAITLRPREHRIEDKIGSRTLGRRVRLGPAPQVCLIARIGWGMRLYLAAPKP